MTLVPLQLISWHAFFQGVKVVTRSFFHTVDRPAGYSEFWELGPPGKEGEQVSS